MKQLRNENAGVLEEINLYGSFTHPVQLHIYVTVIYTALINVTKMPSLSEDSYFALCYSSTVLHIPAATMF